MNRVFAVICMGFILILIGCSSPEPTMATEVNDITGIYAVNPGNTVLRFDADGTLYAAPSMTLAKNPIAPPGEFWFEGDFLYLSSTDDPVCGTQTAIYQVELLDEGKLRFYPIEDACEHRVAVFQGVIDPETGIPNNIWSPVE